MKPLSASIGDSQCLSVDDQLLDELSSPETYHLSNTEFERDDYIIDSGPEEDYYSEDKDMLDDRDSVSEYDSDFGSDDGDGYDSAEELHWDHDFHFSTCPQGNKNYASCYGGDSYMPGGVWLGENSDPIYGSHGAIFWRDERNTPSSIGSPDSLAISEDDMLDI